VESLEAGPKGLSNDEATPLCCWQEAMAAREVVGSCWRAQTRSIEPEAAERAMTNEGG